MRWSSWVARTTCPYLHSLSLLFQGEPFGEVKKRLQKRLDVKDGEWERYRFALVVMGRQNYLPDDDDSYTVHLNEFVPHSVQSTWQPPISYSAMVVCFVYLMFNIIIDQ